MIRCLLALILFLSLATSAKPVDFGMKPAHFAPVMEFYYLNPHPEKLRPMLRSMSESGILDLPENRLLFAAFFGELMAARKLPPATFLEMASPLGKNGRRMAAWAMHLSGLEAKGLLDAEDRILDRQIMESPRSLRDWPLSEPSMIPMFWAAFMATGERQWVERIIESALGMGSKASQVAAASLYDFAPRHPVVIELLEKKTQTATGNAKKIIDIILTNAAGKSRG